jgi:hypothetical protein
MTGEVKATEIRALYALGGIADELAKTLPVDAGDVVLSEGYVSYRYWRVLTRLAYARLTKLQFDVAVHYAFKADRIVRIPGDRQLGS